MAENSCHCCKCSICQGADGNPTKAVHRAMNMFFAQLDNGQKKMYIGLEAKKRGAGSERSLSLIFGWDEQAIAVAKKELEQLAIDLASPENPQRDFSNECIQSEQPGPTDEQIQYNNAKIAMAASYLEKQRRQSPTNGYYKTYKT